MWNARRPHLLQIVCVLSCLLPNEEVPLVYTHGYNYSRQNTAHSIPYHSIPRSSSTHLFTTLTIQEYGIQQYFETTRRCAFNHPSFSIPISSLHKLILSHITPIASIHSQSHTITTTHLNHHHSPPSLPSSLHIPMHPLRSTTHTYTLSYTPIPIFNPFNPIGQIESTGSTQSTNLSLSQSRHRTAESTPFHSQLNSSIHFDTFSFLL